MAGLDPAIQRNKQVFRRTDVRRLDGAATLSLAATGAMAK
jgi:hypothetical protein